MVIRIGTSGWSYDHWHPELYPPGLAVGDRLARYAATFPTAELTAASQTSDDDSGCFRAYDQGQYRVPGVYWPAVRS
jgi:hypothetical protein